jgi:hypothetical protein
MPRNLTPFQRGVRDERLLEPDLVPGDLFLHDLRRIPVNQAIRRGKGGGNAGAGSDNAAVGDDSTLHDRSLASDPDIVSNRDAAWRLRSAARIVEKVKAFIQKLATPRDCASGPNRKPMRDDECSVGTHVSRAKFGNGIGTDIEAAALPNLEMALHNQFPTNIQIGSLFGVHKATVIHADLKQSAALDLNVLKAAYPHMFACENPSPSEREVKEAEEHSQCGRFDGPALSSKAQQITNQKSLFMMPTAGYRLKPTALPQKLDAV